MNIEVSKKNKAVVEEVLRSTGIHHIIVPEDSVVEQELIARGAVEGRDYLTHGPIKLAKGSPFIPFHKQLH